MQNVFFMRSGVGWLSVNLVFALRLELFTLSQPDISFSSLVDIYIKTLFDYYIVLHWTRGMSKSSNF